MNYKHLLKFYFNADGLNGLMDSACLRLALTSADGFKSGEYYADRISEIVRAKCALGELWAFLDGVMKSVPQPDRSVLQTYSESRGRRQTGEEGKALHRALMKFSRRVSGRLERYAGQVNVLREYFCLVCAAGG